MKRTIEPIRHGLVLALLAMIFGALWAGYLATHHELLHSGFEQQQTDQQQAEMQALAAEMSMDDVAMEAMPSSPVTKQVANPEAHAHPPSTPQHEHDHAAAHQHSHTGSLAGDAMQRLLRGHIHFMGLGLVVAVLLLITAFTGLKSCYKKLLGWSFSIGALAYPPAWIIMGFRTVEMGPEAAEASIMWLFAPAVALLLASMGFLLLTLFAEWSGLSRKAPLLVFFQDTEISS